MDIWDKFKRIILLFGAVGSTSMTLIMASIWFFAVMNPQGMLVKVGWERNLEFPLIVFGSFSAIYHLCSVVSRSLRLDG